MTLLPPRSKWNVTSRTLFLSPKDVFSFFSSSVIYSHRREVRASRLVKLIVASMTALQRDFLGDSYETGIPFRWVCLGLGQLSSRKSLYQLALFLTLQEAFASSTRGHVYDPIWTETDYDFLKDHYHLQRFDASQVSDGTACVDLYFMPHCPWSVCDSVMQMQLAKANNASSPLFLVGNAFSKLRAT